MKDNMPDENSKSSFAESATAIDPTQPKKMNFLHHQDIFGYRIPLNFNRRHTFHTTKIGGLFSIMIKIIYVFYFAHLLLKMINYKDDKTYLSEYDQQEEIESVNFNDINLKLYHALYHIN